jgi:hypothetical protein
VFGDGSVRLADVSDSFVNFDGNSQPIGQPVTFTATVSNLAGLDGVFVASGDVDGVQNNLKQIAVAFHALDAGECSVDICAQNSPLTSSASGESVYGFGLDRGHMGSSFDLVFPTQTAFPQRESNAVATESLEIAHEGFLGDSKGVINWFSGDGGTIGDPGIFPTETTRPMESDGRDDGWCMGTEIDSPESVHALYDLVV